MLPSSLSAQSLLDRTPNVSGGWVGVPGTIYFNFLHRFTNSGPPERQVTNYPTFLLAFAPLRNSLLGVNYATRSDVAPRFPNEYEIFARYAPVRFVSLQAGYNQAAESVDSELGLSYVFGPLRLLAAGRMFSNGYNNDEVRYAIAAGGTLRLSRYIAIGGDVAQLWGVSRPLIDPTPDDELAWSGALQLAIPYTPHTLSIQAANTSTATLQGSSRGMSDVRYGFEFTVPVTLSRYFSKPRDTEVSLQPARDSTAADMRALQFMPATIRIRAGTAVIWKNNDQVGHTVTAEDRSWTSPMIEPGRTYRRVFTSPGTFNITCTPHPFMKAVVEVVS
jgi:plastocyanin